VNKELQSDLWHNVGEGDLVMPRPSFKAAEYGNYGELPLQKAFAVYPNQTVGVCIMTSSREGIVVREGEALKKPGSPMKALKEYVVSGPKSAAEVDQPEGSLMLSVGSLISNPGVFAEKPRTFCGFVGGITYSYAYS